MNNLLFDFIENAYYYEKDIILIEKIINFLTKHVRNKSCIKGLHLKNNLHKLMCKFSLRYSSKLNKSNIKINDIKKINSGQYGEIYRFGSFENIPIIIKSPLEFREKNIREIYINYVIINSLLMKNDELYTNLIPTYGFFICNHTYKKDNLISLCEENKDDYPNIHLVQKFADAKEFQDFLEDDKTSFSQFKKIFKKVFIILSKLENTRFKLYHNDLHSSNILIDNITLEPYIIDFGISSFKVGNNYYINSWESIYNNNEPIYTGLHDFASLLKSCIKHTKNNEIKKYCKNLLKEFVFDKLWEGDNIILKKESIKSRVFYLYDELYVIENKLPKKEKDIVHHHNLNILKKMKYHRIVELIEKAI